MIYKIGNLPREFDANILKCSKQHSELGLPILEQLKSHKAKYVQDSLPVK